MILIYMKTKLRNNQFSVLRPKSKNSAYNKLVLTAYTNI
jgi:hypothetical protein